MSISSIGGTGGYPYVYTDSRKKTADGGFEGTVDRALEEQGAPGQAAASAREGDLVILQPPDYTGFVCDDSFAGKSKEEMTMDEYKQWFLNETSKMPVSAWVKSTVMGGSLTVTEECFARMKEDPEWEQTVLDMVRRMYSVNGIMGSKMIGYQVIGASPEQCYGAGIPVRDASFSGDSGTSWWAEYHKRAKEQTKELQERAFERREVQREVLQREALQRELYRLEAMRASGKRLL